MAETVFNEQTVLELQMDQSSMGRVVKNIQNTVSRAFKDFNVGRKVGRVQARGMGGMVAAGAFTGEVAGHLTGGGGGGKKGKRGDDGGIVKTLGTMAVGIGVIAAFWEAVGPILKPLIKILSAVILILLMPFIRAFMPILRDTLPDLIDFVKKISQGIESMLTKLGEIASAIGGAIGGAVAGASQVIGGAVETGAQIAQDVGGGLGNIGATIFEILVSWFTTQIAIAGEIGTFILTTLQNVLQTSFNILETIGQSIFDSLTLIFETGMEVLNSLGSFVKNLLEGNFDAAFQDLVNIGTSIFNMITGVIKNNITMLGDIGQEIFDLVSETVENGMKTLENIGQMILDFAKGVLDSINIGGAVQGARDFVGGVVGAVTGSSYEDFIMRPGQKAVSFSPQDTVIGVKDVSKLFGGGGVTFAPTYHISPDVSDRSLEQAVRRVNNEMLRDMKRQGSFGGRIFNA